MENSSSSESLIQAGEKNPGFISEMNKDENQFACADHMDHECEDEFEVIRSIN